MKKSYKRASYHHLFLLFTTLWCFHADGQVESFPGFFTYYDPANPNLPIGSDTTSNAILYYDRAIQSGGLKHGTMFLINTFRDDDTVCVCMTGHQAVDFFPDGHATLAPFSGNFNVAMKYLGKDSLANINGYNYFINHTVSFSRNVATGAG